MAGGNHTGPGNTGSHYCLFFIWCCQLAADTHKNTDRCSDARAACLQHGDAVPTGPDRSWCWNTWPYSLGLGCKWVCFSYCSCSGHVITSYSIHYTKLYEQKKIGFFFLKLFIHIAECVYTLTLKVLTRISWLFDFIFYANLIMLWSFQR